MKTYSAKAADAQHGWYVVDAADKRLGRLSTEVARRLRGKHKAEYTPNIDMGDNIVIINAEKITVTGRKFTNKMYHHHTGFPGGLKSMSFEKMQERHPTRIIEKAIKGMLPKGPLGRDMYRKLKVYAGSEHPHTAQQPEVLEIEG